MDTYDLDDPEVEADRNGPGTDPASRSGRSRSRSVWWGAAGLVLLLVAGMGFGHDERTRAREFDALMEQVTQGQSAVRYTDARIQAITAYVSPQLLSARAPASVRAGLGTIVQQVAAGRIAPMQAHRDDVAALSVARWHGAQRRAQAAYLAYLDDRIEFARAVSADVDALFRSRPAPSPRLAEARKALLAVSPDPSAASQVRDLLK